MVTEPHGLYPTAGGGPEFPDLEKESQYSLSTLGLPGSLFSTPAGGEPVGMQEAGINPMGVLQSSTSQSRLPSPGRTTVFYMLPPAEPPPGLAGRNYLPTRQVTSSGAGVHTSGPDP